MRIPARDPSQRIGVLLAKPGRHRSFSVDFSRVWVSLLSNDIRNRFVIVAFDRAALA